MGNERKRKGKHLFLYSACLLTILVLSAGCVTAVNSQKRQGNRHLEQAGRLANSGDYTGALKEYEAAAGLLSGNSPEGDSAIFHMGLIWAHPDNPERDYNKALEYFQRLVRDYPRSSLMVETRVLTDAISELILRDGRIIDLEDTQNALGKEIVTLKETYISAEEKNKILEDTIRSLKKQINTLKQGGLETEEKNKELEEMISALKNQLNALKEIDLGIEEKKR